MASSCKTLPKNAKPLVPQALLNLQLAIVLLSALAILKHMVITKSATINASMRLITSMLIIPPACVFQLALPTSPISQILSVETVFFSAQMAISHKIRLILVVRLVRSDLQIISLVNALLSAPLFLNKHMETL